MLVGKSIEPLIDLNASLFDIREAFVEQALLSFSHSLMNLINQRSLILLPRQEHLFLVVEDLLVEMHLLLLSLSDVLISILLPKSRHLLAAQDSPLLLGCLRLLALLLYNILLLHPQHHRLHRQLILLLNQLIHLCLLSLTQILSHLLIISLYLVNILKELNLRFQSPILILIIHRLLSFQIVCFIRFFRFFRHHSIQLLFLFMGLYFLLLGSLLTFSAGFYFVLLKVLE